LSERTRKLTGQVAVVTGAGRGLGRGYALRLAELGANVAVVDIDLRSYLAYDSEAAQMTAESTAEEVRAFGVQSVEVEADVAEPASIGAAIGQVLERWGRIDVLVCNAGGGALGESHASLVDLAQFDNVLRRNLYGTVHTVVAAAPTMKDARRGKIITVSSAAGRFPTAEGWYADYGAAKAGIIMYTQYLAQELGPYGITANCIAPGFIGTGRLLGYREVAETAADGVALGRIGTVEECARVVEFLATDLSDFVTGVVIPVDGGSRS
jgi:3-oxoacyl-[acyl-carrier protein] reductase